MKTGGSPQEEWRHAGKYPPFRVAWQAEPRPSGVAAVFPHPTLPDRVAVAAAAGLFLSDNAGRTWTPLPEATLPKLGPVRHVGFDPATPDAFYLATEAKGVWASADGGKTLRQIGSAANGLASDATLAVHVYPPDPRRLTLLVLHGSAAPGLSLSEDGGRSWRVVSPEYHAWKLLCGDPSSLRLGLAASARGKPDVRSILSCGSLGEPWYTVVRDVVPTDGASTVLRGAAYWSTADAGVHVVTHGGANFEKVGPDALARLASLGVTWGHHADNQLFYAYEPTKLGMAVSTDGFKSFFTESRGLYTSPFVAEGAHLRANANGTAFYAVANGVLCKGYRFDGPLKLSGLRVSPPAATFAYTAWHEGNEQLRRCLGILPQQPSAAPLARLIAHSSRDVAGAVAPAQVALTAAVVDPRGKPRSVTVDLSRLGGSPATPLADDGQHGDGAAGDGVYGATITLRPADIHHDGRDWRREWPGSLGLSVTAVGADGALAGAVAVLFLGKRPEGFRFWPEDYQPSIRGVQGTVAVRTDPQFTSTRFSRSSWRITAGPGPWRLPIGDPYHPRDITGFHALSFWLRADAKDAGDLSVQLRDEPDYATVVTTPPVAVAADKAIQGGALGADFRRVVIPLQPLLRKAQGFQSRLFCWLIFSGEGRTPATYWVDDIHLFATQEDLETDLRLPPR